MTAVRWVATVTVDVFQEDGDDYIGMDPLRAAQLAFDGILKLKAPIVVVERQSVEAGLYEEPDVLERSAVDLETLEVVDA